MYNKVKSFGCVIKQLFNLAFKLYLLMFVDQPSDTDIQANNQNDYLNKVFGNKFEYHNF